MSVVPELAAFLADNPSLADTNRSIVEPGIVYRLPTISTFAWSVSVVPLAIARACLEALVDLARDHARQGSSQPLRERETVQFEVGRADGRLRSARAFLRSAMRDLMEAVEQGEEDLVSLRAQLRLAAAHGAETALQVASTVEAATGAAAIFEGGPLAVRLRDLRAAVQHVAMSPTNFTIAGRLRLGLDPGTSRI
jgi:alkylation response protein AidB-like acyl-CoA dehydrogenase